MRKLFSQIPIMAPKIALFIAITLIGDLLLIGCSEGQPVVVVAAKPAPTINALLQGNASPEAGVETQSTVEEQTDVQGNQSPNSGEEQVVSEATPANPEPTVAALFDTQNQILLVPTATARPPVASQSELNLVSLSLGIDSERSDPFTEYFVYDDELKPNWSLINSTNVTYSLTSTARWFEVIDERLDIHSGAMSIALKPDADFGQLFFTVNTDSSEIYYRDEILGISFWMHTGTEIVDTGDFAVTVVGSNEKTYWSPDDRSVFFQDSVFFEEGEEFSETMLYFLDINRAIPANSWVKIEVWLDELIYDPSYEYVTGIYIKNDAGFRNRVYIDRLTLMTIGQN